LLVVIAASRRDDVPRMVRFAGGLHLVVVSGLGDMRSAAQQALAIMVGVRV
jgi:hypothetical protein